MFKKSRLSLILLLLLLVFWEIATHFSSRLLFVLPRPSHVLIALKENHTSLIAHSLFTLKEMVFGFALALFASFPLAWSMMHHPTTRAFLQPIFIVIQCVPMFTLAPLMVIWFGWNEIAIILPTSLMIFFPLTLNIYKGLLATPPPLLEFFQSNGATPWQTLIKLRLPAALPHIFAGLRISAGIAGIGAVAGEWAGAQKGLGMLMLESRRNSDLEITFSALFLLTLLSLSFYASIVFIEKTFFTLPKKKFLNSKLFLFLLLPLLTCCTQKKETQTRLLLDWLPSATHVPLYAGIDKGFFAEEGIDLLLQKMHESGGGLAYLNGGKSDLLITHMPSALRAISKGARLKMVGVMIKEPLSCLLYRQNEKIQTAADLSGLNFGYCLGDSDLAFVDYLFNEGHISPKESLHVDVDMVSALSLGRIDFLFGTYWNVEPHQFRALGIETGYFKLNEFGVPNYEELIIVTKEGSLCAQKAFILSFQRALQKSLHFCKQAPEEAFASYVKMNPDKRKKTLTWEKEAWKSTLAVLCSDQSLDPQGLKKFSEWLMTRGFIAQKANYTSLLPD